MLRHSRVSILSCRFVQQVASRTAGTSTARVSVENQTEKPILSAEYLQNKYKSELQNKQIGNLYELIEKIEWSGNFMSGKLLGRAGNLIEQDKVILTSLSDRQVAQLVSVYGSKCDAVSKKVRREELSKLLNTFNNNDIALGPLTRTAVFRAQVDNGELPSVVEELQIWEANNMAPTIEILQEFARVYGLEGNTNGVVDIMNHMKASGMTVDVNIIGSLVYSMAIRGATDQAEVIVKKFTRVMSEVALKTAVAEGLIKAGKIEDALESLTDITKINIAENIYIIRLLCNLLEENYTNGFNKLSGFLNISQDGNTLAEKNNNIYMLSRARSARSEENLEAAINIYGYVHPSYRNPIFEEKLPQYFANYLKAKQPMEKIANIFEKLSSISNIPNPKLFLLESSIHTPNKSHVFKYLEKDIPEILTAKPELKLELSKELSRDLSKKNISPEQRSQIIANVATVLFTKTQGDDPVDAYKVVYAIAGHDVEFINAALKHLKDERVKREISSAAIQQILGVKEDHLKFDKLEKLLNSDLVTSVNIGRIQTNIRKIVTSKEEPDANHYELFAKIVAFGFPINGGRYFDNAYAPKFVQAMLCDTNIKLDRLKKIVDALEQEQKVRLSRDDVLETKNKMNELKLQDRIELLERLKAQGQTFSRWMASSVTALEDELASMEANGNVKRSAIHKIQEVIVKKATEDKTVDFFLSERIIKKISESEDAPARLKRMSIGLWEKTFMASLRQNQDDVADKIWTMKTTFSSEAALSYISLLFVKQRVPEADDVCLELIASAQTITGGALEAAGRIVSNYDINRIDELVTYLQEKLHLKPNQSRRIVSLIRTRQMRTLIKNGDLNAAVELAEEESKATGHAFGQYDLFKASFIEKKPEVTEKVYKMIMKAHDKTIAILDLAFAMLENKMTHHANSLLQTSELKISSKKLEFFTNKAYDLQRPDILRSLFFGLHSNNVALISDLNKILMQLTRLYYKNNDFGELEALEVQLKESSFPIEQNIKRIFDMVKDKKGISTEQ